MKTNRFFKQWVLELSVLIAVTAVAWACGDEETSDTETGDTESETETESEEAPALTADEAEAHCPGDLDKSADGFECTIKGLYSEDSVESADALVWVEGMTYVLNGIVGIEEESTLTIEPGAVILGDPDSAETNPSSLFIARGSKLIAEGTADKPIVFSSANPSGERQAGDWGGIVIRGNAPFQISDTLSEYVDYTAAFGGDDALDSSGSLAYLDISFCGRKEVTGDSGARSTNGLTLKGVGAGTEIHHIHVHRSADGGVVMQGGTVSLKHMVVTGAAESAFAWLEGWQGRAQFGIAAALKGVSSAYGIMGINNSNKDEADAKPRSAPTLYNFTIAGQGDAGTSALMLSDGTAGILANILVTEETAYATCVDIEGVSTWEQTIGDLLIVNGSIFPERSGCFPSEDETGYSEDLWWSDGDENRLTNAVLVPSEDGTRPGFLPETEAVQSGAAAPPAGVAFLETVSYVGAVGDEDWTAGWTAFPEN